MFKETYNNMYNQISPSKRLISDIISSEQTARRASKRFVPLYRKPAVVSIALILFLMLSLPALAANVPVIYELMYNVSPAAAQFFKPVQKSCENAGIKMEVVSAYIHDDTVEIYVTIQDLTGSRVDATTDLFDSYSIHRPFDSSATCQRIGFDETTNTATFLISITESGDKNITGDKITFSVREFISGKSIYEDMRIEMDLSDISDTPNTMPLPTKYGGGFGGDYALIDGKSTVLVPSAPISFGVNGIDITGMGYIDGLLHIQTFPGNISTTDNHGYVYFKDKDGADIQSIYSISFNDFQNGEKVRYNEFVFDIPKSALGDYELFGNFVISGNYTVGPWQVTFPLE